jgi:hypothetical protein
MSCNEPTFIFERDPILVFIFERDPILVDRILEIFNNFDNLEEIKLKIKEMEPDNSCEIINCIENIEKNANDNMICINDNMICIHDAIVLHLCFYIKLKITEHKEYIDYTPKRSEYPEMSDEEWQKIVEEEKRETEQWLSESYDYD